MTRLTCFIIVALASSAYADQHLVIVLDDSSSMTSRMESTRESRMEAAKRSLLKVMEQLPPEAQVGLLLLNGSAGQPWAIPIGPVDQQNLQTKIRSLTPGGATPLGRAIKTAADELMKLRESRRYGTYQLLIVTDGESTDGRLLEEYLPDVLSRGLLIDVIGVDMRSDHSLATRVHSYRRADNQESLDRALSELVLGESTEADQTAEESDFEMLAAIPDDVATAALDAMTQAGNEPIEPKAVEGMQSSRSPDTIAVPYRGVAETDGTSAWTITLVMFVLVLGAVAFLAFVLVSLKAR